MRILFAATSVVAIMAAVGINEKGISSHISIPFCQYLTVSTGSQRYVAGRSCKDIYSRGDSTGDGFYWLNSNGTEAPYVTFCDMTSAGNMKL